MFHVDAISLPPRLQPLSLTLQPGQCVALLGANGAGKSTLLQLLAGELPPQSGQIVLDQEPWSQRSVAQQAQQRAKLSQHLACPPLTVQELVQLGSYAVPACPPALLTRLLQVLDLEALAHRPCPKLSGGELQRAHLARVLAQALQSSAARASTSATNLVLLDEPLQHLDPRHQHQVLHVLQRLTQQHGWICIASLHSPEAAMQWANQILLLRQGQCMGLHAPCTLTAEQWQAVYDWPCDALGQHWPLHQNFTQIHFSQLDEWLECL